VKKILVIGIGAGNPDYITIQAINALNQVDVFLVMDKEAEKEILATLHRDICERCITDRNIGLLKLKRRGGPTARRTIVRPWPISTVRRGCCSSG